MHRSAAAPPRRGGAPCDRPCDAAARACFNASCGPFVVCVWCVAPQAAVFRRPMLSPCEPAASGLPIPVLLTAYRPYFAQAAAIRV
jgi:hypothetical protein